MYNFIEIEDKELENIEDDFFENKKYAELLENKIKNNNKFNVLGLYGKWGRGKTTIVKTAEKNILAENRDDYIFINYDAWKYNGNSFKRMFLIEIAKVIDNKKNNSKEVNKLIRILYKTQSMARGKGRVFYGAFILIAVIVTIMSFIMLVMKGEFQVGIPLTFLGVLQVMDGTLKLLTFTSGTVTNTITEHPIIHPEEFEKLFNEIFNMFTEKKVVIVIDNLDRCPSAEAYEVLSSIKCFFNGKSNLLMIIPLDEAAIKEHIKKQFNGTDIEANEYISKIINSNISLHNPNFIKQYEYIDWLCEENKIAFSEKLKLIIAEMDFNNPRQIIVFINSLCNELNLYSKEEVDDKEHLVAIVLFLKNKFFKIYEKIENGINPKGEYIEEKGFPFKLDKYF